MRFYYEDTYKSGSFAEVKTTGQISETNILSGIGFASVEIPGYEGAALATWKARHFKRIQIKDNAGTTTLWEGFIDQVNPTRNSVFLICLEPQARLQRLIAGSWGNFEHDEGFISSITGVGNVNLIDNTQDFTTDEFNNKGLLFVGLDPEILYERTQYNTIVLSGRGGPQRHTSFETQFRTEYSNTTNSTEVHYYHFTGDENDLGKLKIHYHLEIEWTGTDPQGELEIWNFGTSTWDDIATTFSSGVPKKGTHEITANIGNYIDSDGEIRVRTKTTGTSLDYTWRIYRLELEGEWTNDYDGSGVVISDTIAPDTLVTDTNLDGAYVHVGDKYCIGERNDVMITTIFSNETTPFSTTDIEASTHYKYRDYEGHPTLEIIKSCLDVDNAEYWNDVSSGFKFKYKKTFAASGITLSENEIDTDNFQGGYKSDDIVMKATVYGAPESGNKVLFGEYTSGSYVAGDPVKTYQRRWTKSYTELYQQAKAIVTNRPTAHFVGELRCTKDWAALRALTVGQTVNLGIDMDQDGSDEIAESNLLVQEITRTQDVNGDLITRITLGKTPLYMEESTGRPSDNPRFGRGFEVRRDEQMTLGSVSKHSGAQTSNPIPHGTLGGRRVVPLDFANDAELLRQGVTKLKGDATTVKLGTLPNLEDIEGYADLDFTGGAGDIVLSGDLEFDTEFKGLVYAGVEHLSLSTNNINLWQHSNVKSGKALFLWKNDNTGHSYLITDVNGNTKIARQNIQKLIAKLTQLEMGTVGNTEDLVGFNDLDLSGGNGDIDLDKLSIYNYSIEETTGEENLYLKAQAGANIWNTRDIWGDEDIQSNLDLIVDEDVYFGASVFLLYDTGGGNAGLSVTNGLAIYSTGTTTTLYLAGANEGGFLINYVDANEFTDFYTYDAGGSLSRHHFHTNQLRITHPSTQAQLMVAGVPKALYIRADDDGVAEDVFYVQWDGQIFADLGAGVGHVTTFDEEDDLALVMQMDMNDPNTWHKDLHEEGKANLGSWFSLGFGAIKQLTRRIEQLEKERDRN